MIKSNILITPQSATAVVRRYLEMNRKFVEQRFRVLDIIEAYSRTTRHIYSRRLKNPRFLNIFIHFHNKRPPTLIATQSRIVGLTLDKHRTSLNAHSTEMWSMIVYNDGN